MARSTVFSAMLAIGFAVAGCHGDEGGTQVEDLRVDTTSDAAWAQYLANVTFARDYEPRCTPSGDDRPRVLVTGFGRFGPNPSNATGRIVSALVPAATYPETTQPGDGTVDDPRAQTTVAQQRIVLDKSGEVDVCAMILPVYWDLAAVLALREIDAFQPDFVLMNGIAGDTQPIWFELGAVNQAMGATDGSGIVQPEEPGAPILPRAAKSDMQSGLLLSYFSVRAAAEEAISRAADELEGDVPFDEVVTGTAFAGFPRESNTYLCNNLTYAVNYMLDHPGKGARLLEPTTPRAGAPSSVLVRVRPDLHEVPRVFVHWPRSLQGAHIDAAKTVMSAIIDAQLEASFQGEEPFRGSNQIADFGGEAAP